MKCISWNCWGLRNPKAVQELCNLVKQEGPDVVLVMETKINDKRVQRMKSILGFYGCVAVSSEGLSGGIGLFWTTEVLLNLIHFSKSHTDVTGRRKDGDTPVWRLTGFYGEPRPEDRHITWRLIRSLREQSQLPWLCMGDFNEVLYGSEHFGVVERAEWQMRAFREAVEDCNLQDLGFNEVTLLGTTANWAKAMSKQGLIARWGIHVCCGCSLSRKSSTLVRQSLTIVLWLLSC